MREEILVAIVMFLISIGGSIATKNDRKWSVVFLFAASVAGSLAAGMGIRFREIVEGPFGFLDSLLCVCAATVFVMTLARSGVFELLFARIAKINNRLLKSFAVLFFIALPAMFTGFAGASVFTTGKIVGERLQDKKKATMVVAVGSFLGMLLPPNCIPAIIAANGAGSVLPTPYVGFFLPLLVLALPAFVAYAILEAKTLSSVQCPQPVEGNKASVVVLALVCVAVLIEGLLSSFVYIGGSTLAYFVATILLLVLNKGFGGAKQTLEVVSDGLMKAVVPIAVVFALGSFIEVSSMTGVRGIYSLWILPYSVKNVMLVLVAASIIIGFFLSTPIPAFLITYAVFPIGWLANTVVVTGCSVAIALAALVTCRGGVVRIAADELGNKEKIGCLDILKSTWLVAVLVVLMGVVMILFGDNMSFLIL